ncbi:MAG: hypothetical protein JNJ88_07435 [Planctomycetes bacterium]|nr:hypothetical protein [Planctomycetota bacterium]
MRKNPLRKSIRPKPSDLIAEDSGRFLEELQKQADRGVPIVAAAFLEQTLQFMLRKSMVANKKEFDELVRVSKFSHLSRLAFLMGHISACDYSDLRIINDIRNYAAHSHSEFSFNASEVRDCCRGLHAAQGVRHGAVNISARSEFISAVAMLTSILIVRGLSATHAVVPRDWESVVAAVVE